MRWSALFELANRLPAQRRGEVGTAAFLEDINALRLPQEVRGAPESDRDHVRLLSAHRAKGLEWELVVVACVQEGQWPDVRLRSDLLHVAELGPRGRIEGLTHADLLAEERRLMYVACTRARSWLVVSAVAERVEGGLQASRFLAELGQEVEAMPARSATPMSAEGLIAALREAAEAPVVVRPTDRPILSSRAAGGRDPAIGSAGAEGEDRRVRSGPVAAADPTRWWGAHPLSGGPAAAAGPAGPSPDERAAPAAHVARVPSTGGRGGSHDSARPLRLSPSAVAALRDCPLRWFLDRRVGAGNPSGGAAVVGLVVHAVAEAIARGDVAPDQREIGPFVDEIWAAVPFPAHYQRVHERRRVDEMITALLAWDASTGRSVAATELTFNVPVPGTVEAHHDLRLDRPRGPSRGRSDPRRRLQDRPDGGVGGRDRGASAAGDLPAGDPAGRPRRRVGGMPLRSDGAGDRARPTRRAWRRPDEPAPTHPSRSGRPSSSTSRTGSPRACRRCASRPRSTTAGPGSTT